MKTVQTDLSMFRDNAAKSMRSCPECRFKWVCLYYELYEKKTICEDIFHL